ncbi:hypothetical protein AGMMS50293_28890 [Spirochaetia bacterium]|nr:hypothetical protein AGMMS50293_28890 [Spirochaetia bacterium]
MQKTLELNAICMYSMYMQYSLGQLFSLLNEDHALTGAMPCLPAFTNSNGQGDLFDDQGEEPALVSHNGQEDITIIAGLYSSNGLDISALSKSVRRLFELSINAFDAFVHAWMSEFPIETETLRFGRKVLAAANAVIGKTATVDETETPRRAAENAAADRGDGDTRIVLDAAYKVRHEVDRLRGFLRFSPGVDGVYFARCAPDHFILPALGEHFTLRFGNTPWAIIDEKRGLSLSRLPGEGQQFGGLPFALSAEPLPKGAGADSWEKLWQHYHKTINNESRNNPGLQHRFIPQRYRKYLPEL